MNAIAQQLLKFWNELGINQRVTLIVASAMVLAGMVALVMWSGQPQMVLLYGGLDGKDMAEVVEGLEEQAVPYELRNGSSIYVPREHVYSVRMHLASQGIPNGGGVGFEIFDRTNFGISDFVQRTNYNRAVQGELQRTIAQLRGVRSARVMIVVPQNRLLVGNEPLRSTASVMVDTGGRVLDTSAVNSIRFLVANSVEGLAANDVVVVDANGNPLSEDLTQDGVIGAASGQFKFRQNLEDYFTKKVESMLARVVGPNNVVARVSVELDTEARTVTEEIYDPASQVVRTQTQTEETTVSQQARDPIGAGAAATAQGEQPLPPSNVRNTEQGNRSNRSVSYEINRSTTEVVSAPGGIQKVTAAVFIAKRYIEQNGQRVEQPRSEAELERLRQVVVNALGARAQSSNQQDTAVTVVEADFAASETSPYADLATIPQKVMNWVDVLRNFMAVAVAVLIFFVFIRILKRHRPSAVSLEVIEEGHGGRGAPQIAQRLTPELLNELIREKPENVSAALKNWALEPGKK